MSHPAVVEHAAHAGHGHSGHGLAHVASKPALIGTFALLVLLTFVTVWVAKHPLGAIDIWVAMGIATIKATAVGLYFMHLRHDSGFNRLVFLSAFLFVFIFIGFAMMDRGQYDPTIQWNEALPKFQAPAK